MPTSRGLHRHGDRGPRNRPASSMVRRAPGPTTAAHSCGASASHRLTRAANPGTSRASSTRPPVEARRALGGPGEERPGAVHQSARTGLGAAAGIRRSRPQQGVQDLRVPPRLLLELQQHLQQLGPQRPRSGAARARRAPGRARRAPAAARAGPAAGPVTRGSRSARAAGLCSSRRSTYAAVSRPGVLTGPAAALDVHGVRAPGRAAPRAGVSRAASSRRTAPAASPGQCEPGAQRGEHRLGVLGEHLGEQGSAAAGGPRRRRPAGPAADSGPRSPDRVRGR